MAFDTNIREQTVEYQNLDRILLKNGHVVLIGDESIDVWKTEKLESDGHGCDYSVPFGEETANEDLLNNPYWTSHNILPAVALHYDKAGWAPHCTGGGGNFPALWFGPERKDADGNDARHLIMVGMEEDVGVAPEDITKPVAAILYDECLRGQAGETEYIREFPSSLALINYVRTFDLETEKGVADIIADWHINSEICKIG